MHSNNENKKIKTMRKSCNGNAVNGIMEMAYKMSFEQDKLDIGCLIFLRRCSLAVWKYL